MRRRLAVLAYHRIGDPATAPPGIVSATPRAFERQMHRLASSGRAVALTDVLAARTSPERLPGGAVLVTFDDAYADFAEQAWPVLRRHAIPVTLFVPTAFPDDPRAAFWWDRLYAALAAGRGPVATPVGRFTLDGTRAKRRAYRRLRDYVKAQPHEAAMNFVDNLVGRLGGPRPEPRVLSWDELRALAADGVTLAPHTRTHPRLDRLPAERVSQEVAGSLAELEAATGAAAPVFAYPDGGISQAAREAVRASGIKLAFTSAGGVAEVGEADLLALPRVNVGRKSPPCLTVRTRLPRHRPALPASAERPAVAYVMSRFPKLTETFILGEILALERSGVRVEIYPLLRERGAVVHPEAAALAAGARYIPFISAAVLSSQLHWLRRCPRAYLGALLDVATGTFGSLNFFAGGLAIFPKVAHAARLMEAEGVRNVHCHFANHPALAGLVIGRLTGLPYSFTAHGSDLHVERRMLSQKVAGAAFVATVSEYNRRLILAECGGRFAEKVHVIRAGIDTALFAPHRNGRPPGGRLRVLCVGTLHEVKGQANLIEACRLLTAQGVEVACRLVGDGPDRGLLLRRIADAGLGGRVVLAGAATRAEIARELAATHVLAAPSVPTRQGKREGIPVVLIEAMSCGLPVVASDLSGVPELVDDGVNGLLTQPGDAVAIAAALRRLHDDPELRSRLGARARQRVRGEFDIATTTAELASRFALEGRR